MTSCNPTTHLEWHNHAFIDENNIVINVAVFDESAHNSQLLEDIKTQFNATKIICCCEYGIAHIGTVWTGSEFIPAKPYDSWIWNPNIKDWESPIPMPEDDIYNWDEEGKVWIKRIFEV